MNPFSLLVTYLVSAMVAWSPPRVHAFAGETPNQAELRYESTAASLATVVLDPKEESLFAGPLGREKTALLLISIASFESGGFRKDVDTDEGTGDGGTSHCFLQVQEPTHGSLDCFRKSLVWIRSSFRDCRRLPFLEHLSEYASGTCDRGHHASERRMRRAVEYWEKHPFTLGEEGI